MKINVKKKNKPKALSQLFIVFEKKSTVNTVP